MALRKILPWLVFSSLIFLIISGIVLKDKFNTYLSKSIKNQASPELIISGDALIDSLYNYTKNGSQYQATFLEFGATGCSACRKMETVMSEIETQYPRTVNVIFLNVLKPENQNLMKYYGIAAIPTQVLLNRDGKEYFRHSGFISTEELKIHFNHH